MPGKSVIIIGAGIAGLSAGCYARMNGYNARIFELHDKPGGLCTAWERKGFIFDSCVHWLMGSAPGTSMHDIWLELGALQGRQIYNHQEFSRYEGANGQTFILYCDLNRLREHMLALSPEDAPLTEELISAARAWSRAKSPISKAPELATFWDNLKQIPDFLPILGSYRKHKSLSVADFADRFRTPLLRDGLKDFFMPEMPLIFLLATFASLHLRQSGYPIGGSLPFAKAIEKRYLDLGGEVQYKARVEKILVENDRAVGVRLADGSEHRADYVISAADGHSTIFGMLEGRYADDKVRGYYHDLPLFQPIMQVSFGLNRDFAEVPPSVSGINFPLAQPVTIAGQEHRRMSIHFGNFDPTLAPNGKTVAKLFLPADYEYWKKLRQEDRERYRAEKEQVAQQVITALEPRFPGFGAAVEVWDIATPATYERYTNNWRASWEGWMITPQNLMMRLPKTLPGLTNFFMAGQWVEPGGGLPPASYSGKHVIQLVCNQDGQPFRAAKP